jgi:hypothetical protein
MDFRYGTTRNSHIFCMFKHDTYGVAIVVDSCGCNERSKAPILGCQIPITYTASQPLFLSFRTYKYIASTTYTRINCALLGKHSNQRTPSNRSEGEFGIRDPRSKGWKPVTLTCAEGNPHIHESGMKMLVSASLLGLHRAPAPGHRCVKRTRLEPAKDGKKGEPMKSMKEGVSRISE